MVCNADKLVKKYETLYGFQRSEIKNAESVKISLHVFVVYQLIFLEWNISQVENENLSAFCLLLRSPICVMNHFLCNEYLFV